MLAVYVLVYDADDKQKTVTVMVAASTQAGACHAAMQSQGDRFPDQVYITPCTSQVAGIIFDSSQVFANGPLPGTFEARMLK
jgi:hypothetical protein